MAGLLLIGLCLLPHPGMAVQKPTPVKAEMIADAVKIAPGQTFTLGVRFHLDPGWHVYWKNPGESGLPTSVTFNLPEGFEAGPLQWPIPVRFDEPGGVVAYGYKGVLLLSARITAPTTLSPGSTVTIGAKASWLSCEKVCIPGQAKLELKLPVAESPVAANHDLFADWNKKLPVDTDSPQSPAVAQVAGSIPTEDRSATFVIDLRWKSAPTRIEWFPTADDALQLSNVVLATEKDQTRITFSATVLRGLQLSTDVLETLVVYTDASGARRGMTVPVRLHGPVN